MKLGSSNILAVPAVFAPITFLVTFLLASHLTPGYSHISDTVSSIATAGKPFALIARLGFMAYGILVIPLGFAFREIYKINNELWSAKVLVFLFCLYGISDLLAGIAIDDLTGETTFWGLVHDLAAIMAFIGISGAIFIIGFKSGPLPYFVRTISQLALIGTLISGVIFYLEPNQSIQGLLQRCFFATTLLWIQIVATLLALKSNRYLCLQSHQK